MFSFNTTFKLGWLNTYLFVFLLFSFYLFFSLQLCVIGRQIASMGRDDLICLYLIAYVFLYCLYLFICLVFNFFVYLLYMCFLILFVEGNKLMISQIGQTRLDLFLFICLNLISFSFFFFFLCIFLHIITLCCWGKQVDD